MAKNTYTTHSCTPVCAPSLVAALLRTGLVASLTSAAALPTPLLGGLSHYRCDSYCWDVVCVQGLVAAMTRAAPATYCAS